MTILTIAPTGSAFSADPFYALGRADAHDESTTEPLTTLKTRAVALIDHITPASSAAQRLYTAGYARRVAELADEHAADIAIDTDRGHKWHSRKKGYGS